MSNLTLTGVGATYSRCSTERQDQERQRQALTAWLDRQGKTVLPRHRFEDFGSRDLSDDRADFQRLLREIEAGRIQWVVVAAIDRLGFADESELFSFIHHFRKHGCQLVTANDDNVFTSRDDNASLRAYFAGRESRGEQLKFSDRNHTGKQRQAREGTYAGGPIPFGCDLVCHDGAREVWRFVPLRTVPNVHGAAEGKRKWLYEGLEIRDGVERTVTGTPPHRTGLEKVRLAPSIKTERLRALRDMFKWYSEESISLGAIAARLNADPNFVHPIHDDRWYGQRMLSLLSNPIYMGLPSFYKHPSSRFLEWHGADKPLSKIETRPGENRKQRKTSKDLWLQPSAPIFEPIIPQEIWDKVQAKCAAPKKVNAPRHETLWLFGLPVCYKCLRPLGSQRYHDKRWDHVVERYCCQTAKKYGADNKTGCKLHSIRQTTLEGVLRLYLDATSQSLDLIRAISETDKAALASYLDKSKDTYGLVQSVYAQMKEFIAINLGGEGAYEIAPYGDSTFKWAIAVECMESLGVPRWIITVGGFDDRDGACEVSIEDVYRYFLSHNRRSAERELTTLQDEYNQAYANLRIVKSPALVQRLEADLEGLQARIDALTASLDSLAARFTDLARELSKINECVRELRVRMEHGSARLKAEAVRRVVAKMVCFFRYVPYGKGERSVPCRVDVHGVEGDCLSFSLDYGEKDGISSPLANPSEDPTITLHSETARTRPWCSGPRSRSAGQSASPHISRRGRRIRC